VKFTSSWYEERARKMYALREEGASNIEIAQRFGVTVDHVYKNCASIRRIVESNKR